MHSNKATRRELAKLPWHTCTQAPAAHNALCSKTAMKLQSGVVNCGSLHDGLHYQ